MLVDAQIGILQRVSVTLTVVQPAVVLILVPEEVGELQRGLQALLLLLQLLLRVMFAMKVLAHVPVPTMTGHILIQEHVKATAGFLVIGVLLDCVLEPPEGHIHRQIAIMHVVAQQLHKQLLPPQLGAGPMEVFVAVLQVHAAVVVLVAIALRQQPQPGQAQPQQPGQAQQLRDHRILQRQLGVRFL